MLVNKKIILSVLIIGCIATVASAGTWAYFEDTKESKDNSISTGTLTLSIDQASLQKFSFTNLYPGKKDENAKTFSVKNSGSIDGHLYVDVTKTNGEAPSHLKVMLNGQDITNGGTLDLGPLTGGQNGNSGQEKNIVIGYNFENVNQKQDEQGKSVTYTITYRLEQASQS